MAGRKTVHVPFSEVEQEKSAKTAEVIGLKFTYKGAKPCDLTAFAEFNPLVQQLAWGMYDQVSSNGLTTWAFQYSHGAVRKFCVYLKHRKKTGQPIPSCVAELTGELMEEYTAWLINTASGGYADNGKKFRALRTILRHYFVRRPKEKNADMYWVKNPFPKAASSTSSYTALTKRQMTDLGKAVTLDLAKLVKVFEGMYEPKMQGQPEPVKFTDPVNGIYSAEYCQWYFDNVLQGIAYCPSYLRTHHMDFVRSVGAHWGGLSVPLPRYIPSSGILAFYKANNVYYRLQSPQLLPYLLLFASRTGINAYSLLNITVDCIKPHPTDPTLAIISWWKGRAQRTIDQPHRTPSTKGTEESRATYTRNDYPVPLIERLIEITAPLRRFASDEDKNHLLLVGTCKPGGVQRLGADALYKALEEFRARHNLDFTPSISSIRPAAGSSVFLATKGDIAKVMTFLGKKRIDDAARYVRDYYAPIFHKEWRHAGITLQNFLVDGDSDLQMLAENLGVPSEQAQRILNGEMDTLMGRCKDVFNSPQPGQTKGKACTAAWKCLVCRSHILFPEDLWKIYSFYNYLVLKRESTPIEEFNAKYAPFMRIVDQDITPSFSPETVAEQKQRARDDPFPAWDPMLVAALESMSGTE